MINVCVKPNSDTFRVYMKNEKIIAELTSPPEQNKANAELIKHLKKIFEKNVKILRGFKSKDKVILIEGLSDEEVKLKLKRIQDKACRF